MSRGDIDKFYRDSVEQRHAGKQPEKPIPEPFTEDRCPKCDRFARLCSDSLCVTCHTAFIREEKAAARRRAY